MAKRKEQLENYSFDTLYIGGGTPSVIDENYIAMLIAAARKNFNLAKDAEITVEINPGTVGANKIEVYNEKSLSGSIRHIIIRIGKKTNEIMITLVTNTEKIKNEKELVEYLISKYPEIKTIAKNINNKNTNVILGNKTEIIYGDGYIYDVLENKKFKISPLSFYQVNPIQTEKLYSKAVEYADLTGK